MRGCAQCIAAPAVATLLAPSLSVARPAVTTDSAVYVERVQPDRSRRLERADQLNRGDRVITVVNWRRTKGDGGFVITNPLPSALAYQGSAWDDQDVSVDGGRTWGRLDRLRIAGRSATAEDVTHVRWRIAARVRVRGQIAYSGIVR